MSNTGRKKLFKNEIFIKNQKNFQIEHFPTKFIFSNRTCWLFILNSAKSFRHIALSVFYCLVKYSQFFFFFLSFLNLFPFQGFDLLLVWGFLLYFFCFFFTITFGHLTHFCLLLCVHLIVSMSSFL